MPQLTQRPLGYFKNTICSRKYLLFSVVCLLGIWFISKTFPTISPLPKKVDGELGFPARQQLNPLVSRNASIAQRDLKTTLDRRNLPVPHDSRVDLSQNIVLCAEEGATSVITVGDPTPRGGVFSRFLESAQNQVGDVVFKAAISGGDSPVGIFLISHGRIEDIAAIGGDSPIGPIVSFSSPPTLNNRGEIAFGTASESTQGILISSGGGLRAVVTDDTPTPSGGRFALASGDSLPLALGDDGKLAFTASVADGPTPAAIFLSDGRDVIQSVVAIGDSSPVGGTFSSLTGPFYSDSGEVFFGASMENGDIGQGIFVASKGQIAKIVADGDPTPVGGTFSLDEAHASDPLVGLRNEVVFHANLSPDSRYQKNFPSTGIFRFSQGKVSKVVVNGAMTQQGAAFFGKAMLLSGNMANLCFVSEIDTNGDGDPDGTHVFSWRDLGL